MLCNFTSLSYITYITRSNRQCLSWCITPGGATSRVWSEQLCSECLHLHLHLHRSSLCLTAADMPLSLGWLSAVAAGFFSAHVLQKLCFPYFWRDLFFLLRVVRYAAHLELSNLTSRVVTVLDRFVQQAHRIPDKPFVIYDGAVHTYRHVERRSNRLANVFLERVKLRRGDCVALLMSNEPDFLCVWFGLVKVGCSVAFLNTNIKSKSLLHCFNCCGAKTLIVGAGKSSHLNFLSLVLVLLFILILYDTYHNLIR